MRQALAVAALLAAAAAARAQTTAAAPEATAWKLSVSFEDDVDGKIFDEWKGRMQTASQLLFELTEGQFWFAEVSMEDKTSRGRIFVPAGHLDRDVLKDVDAMGLAMMGGTSLWKIKMVAHPDGHPGRTWTVGTVVVHELGHAVFGQLDERDSTQKGWECPDCIMGSDPRKLCGKETHKGTAPTKSCKELIAEKVPGVKFPNPKWKSGGKAPKVKFAVTDRGPKDPSPEFAPFTPEEAKVVKEMAAHGRALSIKVAFQGDVDAARLGDWKNKVAELDALLRLHTKEQFFIAEAVVEDRCEAGDITIEKGCEGDDATVLKSNPDTMFVRNEKGWLTVGTIPAWNFARYLLPAWLKIEESSADCVECFFNSRVWDGRTKPEVCDGKTHKGGGKSCGELLAEEWKDAGIVPPETVKAPKPMPATRYRIVDNK